MPTLCHVYPLSLVLPTLRSLRSLALTGLRSSAATTSFTTPMSRTCIIVGENKMAGGHEDARDKHISSHSSNVTTLYVNQRGLHCPGNRWLYETWKLAPGWYRAWHFFSADFPEPHSFKGCTATRHILYPSTQKCSGGTRPFISLTSNASL